MHDFTKLYVEYDLDIGAVSYLNSKPLVEGLAATIPSHRVHLDLPSRLADRLTAGTLDVALVPIAEYLANPDWRILSNACIACRGPVLSVKLYFRVPPADVRTLALDEGSRTSACLARLLLWQTHRLRPACVPLAIGEGLSDTSADAVLLIGDRAMQPTREAFVEEWDLGEVWCRRTGLPFVFAAWVAGESACGDLGTLSRVFEHVRDQGVANARTLAEREAPPMGLPTDLVYDYLTKNLHFYLEQDEIAGLQRFAREAKECGLLPDETPFVGLYHD